MYKNDPIGFAIADYVQHGNAESIIVKADLCEDDVMPIDYLFRTYDEMPELEQVALKMAKGKILDIGAGAGCHSKWLVDNGADLKAIDISKGAIDYLKSNGIDAEKKDLWEIEEKYDTILLLMNGIGLAGKLDRLDKFLLHLKSKLNEGGQILLDSTDISYLYQEEDGSMWVDLNSAYPGEMQFKMCYKDVETPWFDWLYLDYATLEKHAEKVGLKCSCILAGESNNYLAQLKH
ncbi:MAG: class I SAM-dependent methyltransferase [Crocinitomicaceae bacterium]